jgi:hypothetical protein
MGDERDEASLGAVDFQGDVERAMPAQHDGVVGEAAAERPASLPSVPRRRSRLSRQEP